MGSYKIGNDAGLTRHYTENFGTLFLFGIREKDAILSSMGDGLAPFVSTQDIAQAAFDCLTVDKLGKQEITLLGPELLTYDDVSIGCNVKGSHTDET